MEAGRIESCKVIGKKGRKWDQGFELREMHREEDVRKMSKIFQSLFKSIRTDFAAQIWFLRKMPNFVVFVKNVILGYFT